MTLIFGQAFEQLSDLTKGQTFQCFFFHVSAWRLVAISDVLDDLWPSRS